MSDERYPGEADEAAADEASSQHDTLTSEQVVEILCERIQDLYPHMGNKGKLITHDATLSARLEEQTARARNYEGLLVCAEECIAQYQTSVTDLTAKLAVVEQDNRETVSVYARMVRELRARLGIEHAPDVNLPPDEVTPLRERVADLTAKLEAVTRQREHALGSWSIANDVAYERLKMIDDLKSQLAAMTQERCHPSEHADARPTPRPLRTGPLDRVKWIDVTSQCQVGPAVGCAGMTILIRLPNSTVKMDLLHPANRGHFHLAYDRTFRVWTNLEEYAS